MLRIRYFGLCLLCAAFFGGCGIIINGTSQNVPVKLPAGTIVEQETEEGKLIEIERHAEKDGTIFQMNSRSSPPSISERRMIFCRRNFPAIRIPCDIPCTEWK